jgi:hypothetical protein
LSRQCIRDIAAARVRYGYRRVQFVSCAGWLGGAFLQSVNPVFISFSDTMHISNVQGGMTMDTTTRHHRSIVAMWLVGLVLEALILYPKSELAGWAALVVLFGLVYWLTDMGA